MARTALALFAVVLLAAGCSPCNRIANAEASADDKYKSCGNANGAWSDSKLSQCNDNLKNCSSTDQKLMDSYADCLNRLPTCQSGNGFSWSIDRARCLEPLFSVSRACANGF